MTPLDSTNLAKYLSLLYAKAEGRSEAEMALDILGIDPRTEPARASKAVRAALKRAQWLAANPETLLTEDRPRASKMLYRSKVR